MNRIFVITFIWITFIAFDFLVAAGFSEIWVRLFVPTTNICYTTDDQIGVRFCPNQERYGYVENGYTSIFRTNSQGFHDIERKEVKASGVYRIHIYGDSMVQGKGLQIEDTIPSIIEEYLNSKHFENAFEVMNMASVDDSTSNQIQTYEIVGKRYNPDLVICYFMDDFADNVIETHFKEYSPYHKIDENGELVLIPPIPKDTSTMWERFKKHSRFYRISANKLFESKFYHDFEVFMRNMRAYFMRGMVTANEDSTMNAAKFRRYVCINKSWPLTLRLVKHFHDRVKKDNIAFILVDGLAFPETSVGTVYSNKDLEGYCEDNSISYIPVYQKFAQLQSQKDRGRYFFNDNHPTPFANRELSLYLAELIDSFIRTNVQIEH